MDDINATTDRLLAKLRAFIEALDDGERQVFAALIGPGVALAHRDPDDVEGFAVPWEPRQLPAHLAEAVRRHDLRIVGY